MRFVPESTPKKSITKEEAARLFDRSKVIFVKPDEPTLIWVFDEAEYEYYKDQTGEWFVAVPPEEPAAPPHVEPAALEPVTPHVEPSAPPHVDFS